MYSTFSLDCNKRRRASKDNSTPADQPRVKRTPVPVACDYCRKNRIKCNNSKPCNNCKTRNLTCSHTDTTETRGLIRQVQVLVGKVEDLESRLQHAQNDKTGGENQTRTIIQLQSPESGNESTAVSPNSSPVYTAVLTDLNSDGTQPVLNLTSDFFAAKIDALLQRQNFSPTLSISLVTSTHASFSTSDRSRRATGSINLPRNQQDYYIQLYWRQIHRNLPVVNEDTFRLDYASLWDGGPSQDSRRSSSLVDMVLALALQLDFYSRPGGPSRNGISETDYALNWTWSTADSLYRSSSDDLNRECESPSWATLQCYILMVIYLRNEGRHNTAYQVLGTAIRLSHVLGLHRNHPPPTSPDDALLQDRMRDFLICLDTQQFLEQPRPCGILSCAPRQTIPLDPVNRCFWSYWSELLSITKSIYMHSMENKTKSTKRGQHHIPDSATNQLYESLRQSMMEPLSAWARNVPPKHQLKRKSGAPFSCDYMVEVDVDVPLWQLRQCLLLELSYHWVNMNLLRWYVDSVDVNAPGAGPISSTDSNAHIESAVSHAIAIIGIVDQALRNTDAMYGWYDAHLIQWDAALTIMCFLLCRMKHSKTEEASQMLSRCGSIFESLGTRLPSQAAIVIREFSTHLKSQTDPGGHRLSNASTLHQQQLTFTDDCLTKISDMENLLVSDTFDPNIDYDLGLVGLPTWV